MKLLGIELKGEYTIAYYDSCFRVFDENDNKIYFEDSDGFWIKRIFDENNNQIYYEDSDKYWAKREFDENNNEIYFEDSDGYWEKRVYDKNNNEIYYEDSEGVIINNRPKAKQYTVAELERLLGEKIEIVSE